MEIIAPSSFVSVGPSAQVMTAQVIDNGGGGGGTNYGMISAPFIYGQPYAGSTAYLNPGTWGADANVQQTAWFLVTGWSPMMGYQGYEPIMGTGNITIQESWVGKYLIAQVSETNSGMSYYTEALAFQIQAAPVNPPSGNDDDLSNAYETLVGSALLLGQSLTGPATVYAALCTADPGESGDLSSEVTGGSYARAAVSFGPASPDGQYANDTECLFPETTAAWGQVTHLALCTAASGGAVIMSMPLTASISVAAGEQLRINPGALTVSFS